MRALHPWCSLAAGLFLCVGGGAAGQEPPGSAEILVTTDGPGSARVEARYHVTPVPHPVTFRALTQACTEILDPRLEHDGVEVGLTQEPDGPWLILRDTSGVVRGETLQGTVRYEVRVTGSLDRVPLPVLEGPVPQVDGEREGTVHVEVRATTAATQVVFPHMTRVGTSWSARYVAVPSFVGLASGGRTGTECTAASPASPDGGLVWRFWLLVGIMAAWVPLYLAWARRTGENGA